MPRTNMSAADVAASLGLSPQAVERLAEAGELAGRKVRGQWQFRAGEVANWAAANLPTLRQRQGRSPQSAGTELLISPDLDAATVAVPLPCRTRVSVLYELVRLAEATGRIADGRDLVNSLVEREKQQSTALPGGVAIPHSSQVGRYLLAKEPVVAAGRVDGGIPFGDPSGGLTDLFFLVCCVDYRQHLLYLGRLCRLLGDPAVLAALRLASDAAGFVAVLRQQEEALCRRL